jgi:cysteine-rich repeat protein
MGTTKITTAALALLGAALLSTDADSATAPQHLGDDDDGRLVALRGAALRIAPAITTAAPGEREADWKRFADRAGGSWRALWDADTKTPLRIYGSGIAAPGSHKSPERAAEIAAKILGEHRELVGAAGSDFALAANVLDRSGVRSVGFVQRRCGLRVIGGQQSVRFKRDRLIAIAGEALPGVPCFELDAPVGDAAAKTSARAAIAARYGGDPTALSIGAPAILPLLRAGDKPAYAAVREVLVDSADPIGRWSVYVDAATGDTVARRQRLSFASGELRYRVGERYWAGARADLPAREASVQINGAASTSSATGALGWASGGASITAFARGPKVAVTNRAGSGAAFTASIADGGTALWDASSSELIDAQLTTFIHAGIVKEWLRRVDPANGFYDVQLPAYVNINSSCNAFSDGTSINFFRASADGGCGNTGRIADVIYHEFGHSMHNHSLIPGVGSWDSALSEGLSDFLSATITGDPAMGPGFFGTDSVLRHCDPKDREHVWPDDVGGAHHTGKIYCGTMFDLRKNLIGAYGEADGIALVDHLFYESFRRASSIPATYVEILASDDDDGNLANGTPNECAINEAYARHGMGDPDRPAPPPISPPTVDGRIVRLARGSSELCPGGGLVSAELEWSVRGDESSGGVIEMAETAAGLEAELPAQPWGQVLLYQVRARTLGGVETFPANPADPWYQRFRGDGEVLYCSSFEGDAEPAGWVHGVSAGATDDWQWGAPAGAIGSGDPGAAFDGDNVWGTDLGGVYSADTASFLTSPVIDNPDGFDVVRLQLRRWLTVEDGFYDRASIRVEGGDALWANLDGGGAVDHIDREWRFVDLELPVGADDFQITFELVTDGGAEHGGWNIDDLCVIGYNLPVCGDGLVAGDEQCDDGNADPGDGCSADCTLEDDCTGDDCGPGGDEPGDLAGCGCQSGGGGTGGTLVSLFLGLIAFRRSRRSSRRSSRGAA